MGISNKNIISASVVTYNNDVEQILKLISCIDFEVVCKLYILDNSAKCTLAVLEKISGVQYIHNPQNPGFGASHNIAIIDAIKLESKYHFIINPDVIFDSIILDKMIIYCEANANVGMLMPRILNFDNSIQFLPKLLPTFFSIVFRKVKFLNRTIFTNYEMRKLNQNLVYNTPVLSGCFTLLNINAIKIVGMYDDNFFMYFEDWDLSRRVHELFQTVYYPEVSVYHEYHSGANKNLKLLFVYICSMVYYFNKWGWFIDDKRVVFNKKVLERTESNEN